MKKAGLIKKPPLQATAKMREVALADHGTEKRAHFTYKRDVTYTEYKTRLYFRARKIDEVLEISVYTRADLVRGDMTPRFRIFLNADSKEHVTYDCREEKWRTGKMDCLPYDDTYYSYSAKGKGHASESTRKLVNQYLHTGIDADVERAIINFQANVSDNRLKKKYRLITDSIDLRMNTVPELPKDFERFVEKVAFVQEQYVFYKDKLGYCTCCKKMVPVKSKPRHNTLGKCEACGSSIEYKSWNKQKYRSSYKTVSIIQPCGNDEYVYRQFEVYRKVEKEHLYVPEICYMHEQYRAFMDKTFTVWHEYEWGTFKNTGVERWCEDGTVNHGFAYSYSAYRLSVLYHYNLTKLFKGTKLQYMPIVDILKNNLGESFDVMRAINDMRRDKFPYEAFWKMGLKRYTATRLLEGKEGLTKLNKDATKPWQFLKISKQVMNQAIRLNATDSQLRIIQLLFEIGVTATDEEVQWFDEMIGVNRLLRYCNIHTPHRMIRYLSENEELETRTISELAGDWNDYLEMADELGWDIRDRQIFFPQNFRQAHDDAAAELTILREAKEAAKRRESDKQLQKNAEEIREVFDYEDEDMQIVVPESYAEFKQEGNAQHNCVAANYYGKAVRGETIIFFIRKKAEPEKSFCTVEIGQKNGKFKVWQNRTIYNHDAPKEAKTFLSKAIEQAQQKVDEKLQQVRVAI